MLRMMRRNVLVDSGERQNVLGSVLIETPDAYKRLNSTGVIVDVAPGCRVVSHADIGSRCVVGLAKSDMERLTPDQAEACGLSKTWHFICHESKLVAGWNEARRVKSKMP